MSAHLSCPDSHYETSLPESAVSVDLPGMGETAQEWCPACGEHHRFEVVNR